jgi:hypothetical protein
MTNAKNATEFYKNFWSNENALAFAKSLRAAGLDAKTVTRKLRGDKVWQVQINPEQREKVNALVSLL